MLKKFCIEESWNGKYLLFERGYIVNSTWENLFFGFAGTLLAVSIVGIVLLHIEDGLIGNSFPWSWVYVGEFDSEQDAVNRIEEIKLERQTNRNSRKYYD